MLDIRRPVDYLSKTKSQRVCLWECVSVGLDTVRGKEV